MSLYYCPFFKFCSVTLEWAPWQQFSTRTKGNSGLCPREHFRRVNFPQVYPCSCSVAAATFRFKGAVFKWLSTEAVQQTCYFRCPFHTTSSFLTLKTDASGTNNRLLYASFPNFTSAITTHFTCCTLLLPRRAGQPNEHFCHNIRNCAPRWSN